MSDMHPVRNLSEAEDFINRTDLAIEVYSGLYDWLQRQADSGIYAPKFVYAHIIEQLVARLCVHRQIWEHISQNLLVFVTSHKDLSKPQ